MYEARAVLFSSRHLSRKAARIDAKIDERVNDGSADERGDDRRGHCAAPRACFHGIAVFFALVGTAVIHSLVYLSIDPGSLSAQMPR